jgi:hypothetical protein
VDLALCLVLIFAMIVVRWIASVKMVSVSFSMVSYQEIGCSCAGRTSSDRFQWD